MNIDVIVFSVCAVLGVFWLGLETGLAAAVKPESQCQPGFVMSVRKADGTLDCYYERTDWRKKLERRKA